MNLRAQSHIYHSTLQISPYLRIIPLNVHCLCMIKSCSDLYLDLMDSSLEVE